MTQGWGDLQGRRIGVWGVGVEGRSSLRRLAVERINPIAVVDREAGTAGGGQPVQGFTDGGLEALKSCDVVIRSPGISPYSPETTAIAKAGVEIVSGLGLWLEEAPSQRVACITGTKGKSTTTSIAAALARGLGQNVFVGGNLGSPPWDPSHAPAGWYLIEVSSYQAYSITKGPKVVAVTSLGQDHLTWHHGYDNYVRDKLSLCTRPGVDSVIAAAEDLELQRHRALLGPHVEWVRDTHPMWAAGLRLPGRHNLRNAMIAARVLAHLGVPDSDNPIALEQAANAYQPLSSRLTHIGTVEGVDFVDDSLSTNALASLAAVDAFAGRRIALLAGGDDRGIDYRPLAEGLLHSVSAANTEICVFTVPDNGPRIAAEIRAHAPDIPIHESHDLTTAVRAAYAWASPHGLVLLSPAAPSFGQFRDYRERAQVFSEAMRDLNQESKDGLG